ncbi:hypothetical protein [Gluconobacter oxydans]|uniref:hypothetical protein n=1 Tax=Gluconobacter oxydans TaxID=442 RepID=UPI000B148832|nr:hypothetical protein [Gluconobacter oxydans]
MPDAQKATSEGDANDAPMPRFALSMDDLGFSEDDGADRILNQDEIDSLFGSDAHVSGGGEGSGLEKLLSTSFVSYERLPMLEVVFDRLVRILTTSLRNFTSDNVEVSMDRLASQRFGDYLENVSGQSMFAVFKAEEWDNYGILVLSSSLVYSVIDALLGGRDRVRPSWRWGEARRRPTPYGDRARTGRASDSCDPLGPFHEFQPFVCREFSL